LTGKVVLDAMGSDHAPHVEIDGALAATRDLGVKVILVGQAHKVEPELRRCGWRGDGGCDFGTAQEEEFFENRDEAGQ
jgi:glycerol-3-phosphate acyltransferase PlsX